MRIAPLAVWLANIEDLPTLKKIIEVDVSFTHSNQLVKDAVIIYSATIGYLIRNFDEDGKQVLAFLHARELAEQLENQEIIDWLDNCKKMATDADMKECLAGISFLKKQTYFNPAVQIGHLKHAFILSYYHLLLFHKSVEIEGFFKLAIR